MTKRLATLQRIETVQKRLVALADLRLTQADQRCRDLAEDQVRLREFIGQSDALGAPLAKAALRATHAIDKRLLDAAAEREHEKAQRDLLKRREHAVSAMAGEEAVTARRAAADRELAEILDAWIARGDASLP